MHKKGSNNHMYDATHVDVIGHEKNNYLFQIPLNSLGWMLNRVWTNGLLTDGHVRSVVTSVIF